MFKRILFVLFLQGKQESLERAELINLNFLFWCSQAKRFYYVTTALLFLNRTIFTYDICLDSESEILMAVQRKCNFVKTCPWFSRKNLWCDHFVPITRESTLIYAIKIFWIVLAIYISDCVDKNTAWRLSVFRVILVRIFPPLDWMRRDTPYLSVFSPNMRKYRPE